MDADRAQVVADAPPSSSTSSGSNVAPQDSGTGYAVACQAVKPARHSSWATAGMPKRPASAIRRWARARACAPSAGSTGAVPKERVSWPSPRVISSSQSYEEAISLWSGATPPPSVAAPTHTP